MNLTLHYPDVIGPALVTFTPGNPEFQSRLTNDYTLGEGQASQSLAVTAARQFAADILQAFGVHVDVSADPADYPPTPVPTPGEQMAAEALYALAGRTPPPGVRYRTSLPPSEPTPPLDPILALYLDRAGPYAGPAQRVIARWAAYNHVQLASEREGWTQEGIAGLLATPRCQAVVAALTTFGWGLAAATLSGATTEDHPLATPDVVEAYLAAMEAEGCLP